MPGDSKANPENGWKPTHRHRKGGRYRVLARGKMEADLRTVVVYDDPEGNVWVRPESEFDDGRFTPAPQEAGELAAPQTSGAASSPVIKPPELSGIDGPLE